MRDHVLGIRAVNGAGEQIHSGGRVLKNVTGLDLCKLLTGSHGTLAVITEVTLKVLPAPETTGSPRPPRPGRAGRRRRAVRRPRLGAGRRLCRCSPGCRTHRLVPVLTSALGRATGSATLLRVEDFASSVAYRTARLRADLAPFGVAELLDDATSRALWRAVGNAAPLPATPSDAIWRVSVRPSAGPAVLRAVAAAGVRGFLDWGGGLVWLAGPADTATHRAVEDAASATRGTWTLAARARCTALAAVDVVPREAAPLPRASPVG